MSRNKKKREVERKKKEQNIKPGSKLNACNGHKEELSQLHLM